MADESHKIVPKSGKLMDIKLKDDGQRAAKPPANAKSQMTQELSDWSKWIKDNPKKASKIIREWLEHEEA